MDSMWWAAENWPEYIEIYIHPKPFGYHIQPWPIPVFTAHTCFPCHWQMYVGMPQISPININLSFCPSAYTLFSLFQGFLQHLQLQMDAIQNIFMIFCKLRDACEDRGGGQDLRSFSLPTVSLSCQSCWVFWLPSLRESRGNLCQCLITISGKNSFLTSNLNLLSLSLETFPFVLHSKPSKSLHISCSLQLQQHKLHWKQFMQRLPHK